MARTSAMTGGSNNFQTTSEDINKIRTNFFSDGPIGTLSNTSGVAPMTGVWGVNAQGSPNMTVQVTAGDGLITATPTGQASQRFNVTVDSGTGLTVTIPSNSSGSTVYNWIYVALSATLLNTPDVNGSTVASLVVTTSTSNTTDNSGSVPPYGNLIAIVTNVNLATSITNGNIADSRVSSGANALAPSVTGPGWTSYTPVVTLNGGGSNGNAVITGSYQTVGKTIHFWCKYVVGSSTSFSGMTSMTFTLPATMNSTFELANANTILGGGSGIHGTTFFSLFPFVVDATHVEPVGVVAGAAGQVTTVSATTPLTWGVGDTMLMRGTYQVA